MLKSWLLPFFLVCFFSSSAQTTARRIQGRLQQFVDSLSPEQKKRVLFDFDDSLRTRWTNLPLGAVSRKGLRLDELSPTQRVQFHRILSASFSSQGYLKITSIMHLDHLLNALIDSLHDQGRMDDTTYRVFHDFQYGSGHYFISIFGSPAAGNWNYKIEGHHVSVNLGFRDSRLTYTPLFLGTLPAELHQGQYAGWRVLGQEQDLALALLHSLTPAQKKKAISKENVPEDIRTSSTSGKNDLPEWGIKSTELSPAQQKMADGILKEYLDNLPPAEAELLFRKLSKSKTFSFGWIGDESEEEPHYFVLNAPGFLLEFADAGNHIHSILREKGSEFGASPRRP